MKNKRINLLISDELLGQLDTAAQKNYTNRSDYVRECIVLRLRGSKLIKRQQDEFLERLKKLGGAV